MMKRHRSGIETAFSMYSGQGFGMNRVWHNRTYLRQLFDAGIAWHGQVSGIPE
jgi:hypothetical protein